MSSSSYRCVKEQDVHTITSASNAYKKMGTSVAVKAAARVAGGQLRTQMEKLVHGEPSLSGYQDVGRALTVFEDDDNVVVGIPPDDPLLSKAHGMHQIYQLTDVAHDLAKQAGDIEEKFYDVLFDVVMM